MSQTTAFKVKQTIFITKKSKYQEVFVKTLNKTKFGFVQFLQKPLDILTSNFYSMIERSKPQSIVRLIFL